MKILLLGREGQIAWELRRTLASLGELVAVDRRSRDLAVDLANPDSLRSAIRQVRPQLIVNAAAYTAVDKAEQESALAWRINAEAPGVIAEEALALGAGLIHYSTDYVFAGTDSPEPYRENDLTAPQSVYGSSKLAGEQAITAINPPHLILRTAWIYGRRGHNFLLTMLRLLKEREEVRVVDDQLGAPTWCRLVAEATALLIAKSCGAGEFRPAGGGIFHLSCAGQTSWYGFAQTIRREAQARGLLGERCAKVVAIPTTDYPTPAKRPPFSVLANEHLSERFGCRLPSWETALQLCLEEFPRA